MASVRRSRRRRVAGKALTPTLYAGSGAGGRRRLLRGATAPVIRTWSDANGELRSFRFSSATVMLVPPFGRRSSVRRSIVEARHLSSPRRGIRASTWVWCRSPRTRCKISAGSAMVPPMASAPTRHAVPPRRPESAKPQGDRATARAPPPARTARRPLPPDRPPFGGPAADPASDSVRHLERRPCGDEASRNAGRASGRRAAPPDRRDRGRAAPAAARLAERGDRDRLPPRG